MSKDVTELFETYRECARHLRNTYFSTRESGDWEAVEDFDEVAKVLFQRLVLYKLNDSYDGSLDRAVEDNRLSIVSHGDRMPLMISRDKGGGGYWDNPVRMLKRDDAKIAFKSYFDWDQHGLIDLRYYHGVILECTKHPDLVGHEVLIETIYGRIIFEDA